MKITDEMLISSVKKAVELGILPKYGNEEDYLKHWASIKEILQAALEAK